MKLVNSYEFKDNGDVLVFNSNYCRNARKNELLCIIDNSSYELIKDYCWHLSSRGYASSKVNGKDVQMHNIIMADKLSDGLEVDHINRNKLDNRLCNLRVVSHAENCRNRGMRKDNKYGMSGIYCIIQNGVEYWYAYGHRNGVKYCLVNGTRDKQKAIDARKEWENGIK